MWASIVLAAAELRVRHGSSSTCRACEPAKTWDLEQAKVGKIGIGCDDIPKNRETAGGTHRFPGAKETAEADSHGQGQSKTPTHEDKLVALARYEGVNPVYGTPGPGRARGMQQASFWKVSMEGRIQGPW